MFTDLEIKSHSRIAAIQGIRGVVVRCVMFIPDFYSDIDFRQH